MNKGIHTKTKKKKKMKKNFLPSSHSSDVSALAFQLQTKSISVGISQTTSFRVGVGSQSWRASRHW
jgi:acid phosphatase family membrane protein YuiD